MLSVLLLCVAAAPAAAAQNRSAESDKQTLIKLEQDWNDAVRKKDTATIDRLLADEFVATYEDGSRGDRKRELAIVASDSDQPDSAVEDNFTVRVYGDTAVIWFTLHMEAARGGDHLEVTLSYTDVWVMRDGRWQCVSSQNTIVDPQFSPAPPPDPDSKPAPDAKSVGV
jgi:ketosteroid isomerase-like protein